MRETAIKGSSVGSFFTNFFSVFSEVLRYWVLERATKSEEFFAFVTCAFGIYQVQPGNSLDLFAYAPPFMRVFDDAIGFSLIVIGLMNIWAIWTRNRKAQISIGLINIFIWGNYAAMFIYKGTAPEAYILLIYLTYIFVAYIRNSWEEKHGTIQQFTELPSFVMARISGGSDRRGVYSFGFILKAAFFEVCQKGRY